MDENERALYQQRVRAWQLAEPALDEMRREDIRGSDMNGIRAVIPTAEMFGRLGVEVSAETGLVEQQRWFAKLRHG
jgi:hypothetical protein